jgi:hypothetical protein
LKGKIMSRHSYAEQEKSRISHARVDKFHSGPSENPAPRPPETPAERLARFEGRMLDKCIERFRRDGGELGSLAVQIIAARAEITG